MELVLFDDDEDEKPKKRKQTSKSKSKSKTKTQNNKRRTTTNGSSAKRKPAQNGKSRTGSTRKTNSTYKPRKTSTANRGGGFYLGGDGEGLTLGENRKSTSSKSKKSKSDDDFLTFEIGGSRSEDRPARKSNAPARSGKSTKSGKSAKSTKYTNARSGTAKSSKSDYNRGGLMLMDDEDDEMEYRPKSQKSPVREHQQKSNEDWTTPSSSTKSKSKSKSESDEEVGLMEGLSKFSHDFRRKRGNATMRKYLSDEEIGDINEDRASKLELAKERKYEKKGERKEKVKKVYDKSKDVTKDMYDSAKSLYGKTKEKTSAYLEEYKNKKDQKFIDTWLPSDFDREGKSTEELLEIAKEQKEWKDNLRKQGRDEEKDKIKKQNDDKKRQMEEGREEDMRAFADQYLMESEKTGDVKKDYKLAKKIQAGQRRETRKAEAKRKAEERKRNKMQKRMNKETNGEVYGPVRPSEAEVNLPNATAVDTGVKHGPPTKVEAIRENIARMEEQRKAEGKNDY